MFFIRNISLRAQRLCGNHALRLFDCGLAALRPLRLGANESPFGSAAMMFELSVVKKLNYVRRMAGSVGKVISNPLGEL